MSDHPGAGEPTPQPPEKGPDPKRPDAGPHVVWGIVTYLIAGVIAWGGIGWLLDRWLGTSALLPIGILVGFGGAFYIIIRRYGSV